MSRPPCQGWSATSGKGLHPSNPGSSHPRPSNPGPSNPGPSNPGPSNQGPPNNGPPNPGPVLPEAVPAIDAPIPVPIRIPGNVFGFGQLVLNFAGGHTMWEFENPMEAPSGVLLRMMREGEVIHDLDNDRDSVLNLLYYTLYGRLPDHFDEVGINGLRAIAIDFQAEQLIQEMDRMIAGTHHLDRLNDGPLPPFVNFYSADGGIVPFQLGEWDEAPSEYLGRLFDSWVRDVSCSFDTITLNALFFFIRNGQFEHFEHANLPRIREAAEIFQVADLVGHLIDLAAAAPAQQFQPMGAPILAVQPQAFPVQALQWDHEFDVEPEEEQLILAEEVQNQQQGGPDYDGPMEH